MANEYLKIVLKGLDRYLRKLPRQEKVIALNYYRFGLEESLHESYPDEFDTPAEFPVDELKYIHFFRIGIHNGKQFGPLEAKSAREFLLAEMEKRKTKFSKPGFLEKLDGFLSSGEPSKPRYLQRVFWEELRGKK
ncbi:hypothetical protein A3K73_02900 [Candidatus Pacearchaeota archaeon RBG_13_36_9]|nr:MAG: hypothetical protein A3K73_02900 [Candidatus Pacearchaeota archaeon RBG_13_36_9]